MNEERWEQSKTADLVRWANDLRKSDTPFTFLPAAIEVAAAEISAMRRELEQLRTELEALKRGRGEPVGIIVRESYGNSVALNGPGDALPVGAALYTSAPQPAAAIDERSEFECRITNPQYSTKLDGDGLFYIDEPVQDMWAGWQLRAKLNAQPAPAVPEKKPVSAGMCATFRAYGNGWNDCRAAMLAAAPEQPKQEKPAPTGES